MRARKPRSSPAPPHRRAPDSPQTTLGRSKAPPPQTFLTYPRRGGALLLPFSLSKKPRRVCARRRKESLNHFLRRHVRRRKYFSARKRASVSECAAASRYPPLKQTPQRSGVCLNQQKRNDVTPFRFCRPIRSRERERLRAGGSPERGEMRGKEIIGGIHLSCFVRLSVYYRKSPEVS